MSHRRSVRLNNKDAQSRRSKSSYIGVPIPMQAYDEADADLVAEKVKTMQKVVKLLADVKGPDNNSHDKMLSFLLSDELLM